MKEDLIEIPITLKEINSKINVVSFRMRRAYFKEPFFIDSLVKKTNISESQVRLPSEDELLSRPVYYNEQSDNIIYTPIKDFIKKYKPPFSISKLKERLGFIFHMSRCGSTLFAQMLGGSDIFFVLSEPTIINSVLDPALKISKKVRSGLILSCAYALNLCAPTKSKKTIIKFRSWSILYLDFILRVFGEVPWIFIHRNGLEVLASVMEKPPGWLRSKKLYSKYFSSILKVGSKNIINMSLDEFSSRILGKFCRIANNNQSHHSIFLDYLNIKIDFFDIIKKDWSIELSDQDKKNILKTSTIYSKDVEGKKVFVSDGYIKQRKISDKQKEFALKFIESERVKLFKK